MKKRYKYLIVLGAGLLFVLLIAILKKGFSNLLDNTLMQIWCDSFFAVGVVILGVGVLFFASNGGAFDMLAFGIIKALSVFQKYETKQKYKDYYEYRNAKQENKRSFSYFMLAGSTLILISLIFLILVYTV